jgi:hypothetical protein
MLIAKSNDFDRIVLGTDLVHGQTQNVETSSRSFDDFSCPICDMEVKPHRISTNKPLNQFKHKDGSNDCFAADSVSKEHRLATEVSVKVLYNRVMDVTGGPVKIDIEKRIGDCSDFVISDVRIDTPIKIAVEVYYNTSHLELGRRLSRYHDNGYRVFLVFHQDGRFSPSQVEKHLRKFAPIRVGRFNQRTFELTLSDLITSEQIEIEFSDLDRLPNYFS